MSVLLPEMTFLPAVMTLIPMVMTFLSAVIIFAPTVITILPTVRMFLETMMTYLHYIPMAMKCFISNMDDNVTCNSDGYSLTETNNESLLAAAVSDYNQDWYV